MIQKYAFSSQKDIVEFANIAAISDPISPVAPTRSAKDPDAAGLDLYAAYDFCVPACDDVMLWPKSRHNHLLGGGIVDKSYTGPIYVKIVNYRNSPMYFSAGDSVCQMVKLSNVGQWDGVEQVEKIEKETARGNRGGITGVSVDSLSVGSTTEILDTYSRALDSAIIHTTT